MSLANTLLQNVRLKNPDVSKNINRRSRYGALDVALNQTAGAESIITGDMQEQYRSSIGRTVQIPVFDSEAITITSTRPVTISAAENTSNFLAVTSNVYSFGFTMVPVQHYNNEIDYMADFEKKLMKRIYAAGAAIDTALLGSLNTYKNKIWTNFDGAPRYVTTNNIFTAAGWDSANAIFGDVKQVMNSNDFYGNHDVILNPGMASKLTDITKMGVFNDKNEALQLMGFDVAASNRLANPTGFAGCGYAVEKGSFGVMFSHEREALRGARSRTGHEWDIVNLPVLNLPADSYYYESVSDLSSFHAGTADVTRGIQEYFHFAIEMATVVAYNDDLDTYANPIVKFGYGSGS